MSLAGNVSWRGFASYMALRVLDTLSVYLDNALSSSRSDIAWQRFPFDIES